MWSAFNLGLAITPRGQRSDRGQMAPQESYRATPPALEVELHSVVEIAVATLRGEHDLSGKQALADALEVASAQGNVLVDLAECTFIDSTIIGVLVGAAIKLEQAGGRFELIIPPQAGSVHRVAQIAALSKNLVIHERLSAGIASLQAKP